MNKGSSKPWEWADYNELCYLDWLEDIADFNEWDDLIDLSDLSDETCFIGFNWCNALTLSFMPLLMWLYLLLPPLWLPYLGL